MADDLDIVFWELPDWRWMDLDLVFFSCASAAPAFTLASFYHLPVAPPHLSQSEWPLNPPPWFFTFTLCPPVIFMSHFHHPTLLLENQQCLQDEPNILPQVPPSSSSVPLNLTSFWPAFPLTSHRLFFSVPPEHHPSPPPLCPVLWNYSILKL